MTKSSVSSLAAERLHLIRALMSQALSRDRAEVTHWLERLEKSAVERRLRLQQRPKVSFPKELPITGKAAEIIRTIQEHRVIIIAGETGCGKSTQIPKMCLAAGRGIAGKIGCTQPRRIAAVTIADRIAEELGESIGRSVGYKIRFHDKTPRSATSRL